MKRNTYALKGMDSQGLAYTSQYSSIYKRTRTGKVCAQTWKEYTSKRAQKRAPQVVVNVNHVTSDRTRLALRMAEMTLPERIDAGIPAEIARLHIGDWTGNDIKMALAILG